MTEDLEEGHDMEVVERGQILDGYDASVYTKACQDEGCNYRIQGVEAEDVPETVAEIEDLAWDLYESFYDRPRSIGYFTLSALVGGESPMVVVDFLAGVVDLAVKDGAGGHEKRDREAVFSHPSVPEIPLE